MTYGLSPRNAGLETGEGFLKLQIIIPIYNEEDNLSALFSRVREACEQIPDLDWSVIYVNDGSGDDSLNIMQQQRKIDERFSIIDLSRNFGHQSAIAAGLSYSDADVAIIMDGDLQDPPELIPALLERWKTGAKVVRAQRKSRKERGPRRIGIEVFHRVFKWISDFPIPPNTGIFGLLDREALNRLNELREKNRFFPGLRSWIGFEQDVVVYDRGDRAAGEPKQSLKRLARYALDAIFSFSYKPLRLMTFTGVLVSAAGFLLATLFVFKRLMGIETAQTGFTTLVTLLLFLGGVQLIAIGLLGEYLARIYDEVKQRPLYIVKRCYGLERPNGIEAAL
jgi:dolichol-phosphate mannosyltransferase